MVEDYKEIHIGAHIKEIAEIKNISIPRACAYLKCDQIALKSMFTKETLDTGLLLKWSKLLDYNFFMFYHTHLQLYKPLASTAKLSVSPTENKRTNYDFRKNLYSPEIIDWLLGQLDSGSLSVNDIIQKYHIPKTTIYRWKKKSAHTGKEVQPKKKSEINYKDLYIDFISGTKYIDEKSKTKLKKKIKSYSGDFESIKNLKEINSLVEKQFKLKIDQKRRQSLNTYDKEFVKYILSYQEEYNLSDNQISIEFKLSRNTIGKWRKTFSDAQMVNSDCS